HKRLSSLALWIHYQVQQHDWNTRRPEGECGRGVRFGFGLGPFERRFADELAWLMHANRRVYARFLPARALVASSSGNRLWCFRRTAVATAAGRQPLPHSFALAGFVGARGTA